jgi:hypothetical protein
MIYFFTFLLTLQAEVFPSVRLDAWRWGLGCFGLWLLVRWRLLRSEGPRARLSRLWVERKRAGGRLIWGLVGCFFFILVFALMLIWPVVSFSLSFLLLLLPLFLRPGCLAAPSRQALLRGGGQALPLALNPLHVRQFGLCNSNGWGGRGK